MRVRVVLALLCLAAAKGITVTVPWIFRSAVDMLNHKGAEGLVLLPLGLIIAYGLARTGSLVFTELREIVFIRVAARAMRDAGLKTFQHLHELSLRFHMDRQTGGLSRSVEHGVRGIDELLGRMLFSVVPVLFEILMVCGVLWALFNFWFAAVTLGTVVFYIGWTVTITDWRLKYRREMNEMESEAATKAVDSLLNYETVKYFGNEAHEGRRYDDSLRRYEEASITSQTSLSLLNIGQNAVVSVGLTAIMIMAALGVQSGKMTVGDFVMVNTYMIQLYLPLNFLGTMYREIKQSLLDMEEMFSLMEVEREIADPAGAPPLKVTQGEVVFENVGFDYTSRRQVLTDVSFRVPAGHKVAIVGPSGAGKSTISRLLYRFYDVTAGRVLIDGQDIRTVQQASVRAALGIVPQDTVLFNDTIYYNIAYGRPSATPAEIEQAARLAAIHDFILSLPDGYQTRVGERGLKLSGGEKQRVAIARTILKGPRILLFDEATSALDTHTEKEIQRSLAEVSQNRTTLVIAHRLSTVVDADQILVLDHGRIIERGTHRELLVKGGAYAAMWARQQEQEHAREVLEQETDGEEVVAGVGAEAAE